MIQEYTLSDMIAMADRGFFEKQAVKNMFDKLPDPQTYEFPEYRLAIPPSVSISVNPPEINGDRPDDNILIFVRHGHRIDPKAEWALKMEL